MKHFHLFALIIAALLGHHAAGQVPTVMGQDWTLRYPSPSPEHLRAIAANGTSLLVAVGEHGTILTATTIDATTTNWTLRTSGVTTDLRDVIYADTQFVTVGSSGTILVSSDGIAWTKKPSPSSTDNLKAVVWTGGRLVAVGETSAGAGVSYLSTDAGLSWTRHTIASSTTVVDVTYTGSRFLAVMNSALLVSSDGITWTLSAYSGLVPKNIVSNFILPSTPADTIFVTGNNTLSSINGSGLALVTGSAAAPTDLAVNLATGKLVGVTRNGDLWEWDGTNKVWQQLSTQSGAAFNAVTKFGTQYVAVGDRGVIYAYSSVDGWVAQTKVGTKNVATGIAYNGTSLYVAVGIDMTWTSPDGITWTPHPAVTGTPSVSTSRAMYAVVWNGTSFIASGTTTSTTGNALWNSTDGITWTEQVNPPAPDAASKKIYALARLDDLNTYVLGYDGTKHLTKLSIGTTGFSTFDTVPSATAPEQWAMLGISKSSTGVAANDLLVAVGWGGRTLTSKASPRAWTEHIVTLATGEDFTDITWDKTTNRFVAVTNKGGIWTSATGTSGWTKRKTASKALWCIIRTDNQFIAAGDGGLLVKSFGGDYWEEADIGTSGWINQINYQKLTATTGRLVAAGGYGTFLSSAGTFPVQPEVNFDAASSTMAEAGGTDTIRIALSQAWTEDVTVTLAYTGTATTADYKGKVTTATITAGNTFKDITLTGISDTLDESDETIILTLGSPTGDAKIGSTTTVHTVTIIDDDEVPVFITPPANTLVAVGDAVNLTSDSSGSPPPTWQWYKNNAAISGAIASNYSIASAALGNGGAYVLRLKNTAGTTYSPAAQLGVVDTTDLSATAKLGGSVTLSFGVAGNVTYQWRNSTTNLATTKTLTLTNVQAGDDYYCKVSLPGTPDLDSGKITLTVVSTPPSIATTGITAGAIAVSYSATPTLSGSVPASSWSISGLPAGLNYNTHTGVISGTPTRAGTFTVKLIASNAAGNSIAVTDTLFVNSGALGTFMAIVDGQADVNQNLGGRIDLTTTSTGTFTGKFNDADNNSTTIGGTLNVSSSNPTAIVNAGTKTITLTLDASTGAITGSVDVTLPAAASAPITGWRKASATSARTGAYTFALSPASSTVGSGYGLFTVASTGVLNISGKTPDGEAYTTSSFTGLNGEFGIYSKLYSNAGSVYGRLRLNDVPADTTTNFINGSASWSKTSAASTTLTADGGRYFTPAKPSVVMALLNTASNVKATFAGGDLATASRNPDQIFSVASVATVSTPVAIPANTSLVFTPSTGLFSGQFHLSDAGEARDPMFYGVLIRPAGNSVMRGKGFFLLKDKNPGSAVQSCAVNLVRNP